MKVLCVLAVFLAVAHAGPWPDDMAPPRFTVAPYGEDVAPFGVIDTVVDMVKGMLESGIAIKDKLNNLIEQVNKVIDEITDFFEVIKVLDKIFDQIDEVFMTVIKYADEEIGDMWGADYAKKALNKVVLNLYDTYVTKTIEALQAAVDEVDSRIPQVEGWPHMKYWGNFKDKL